MKMKTIFPTCNICNSNIEIIIKNIDFNEILVLNGTCGSGKTTISLNLFSTKETFIVDGDGAIAVVKFKYSKNYEYNSNEVYEELIKEIIIGLAIDKKIIVNHIFSISDYSRFETLLLQNKIIPKMILLRPSKDIAYKRTQERNCFRNKTERKWVDYFDEMLRQYDSSKTPIIDNSQQTIRETVKEVENLFANKVIAVG